MVRQHLEAAGLHSLYVEQKAPLGLADACWTGFAWWPCPINNWPGPARNLRRGFGRTIYAREFFDGIREDSQEGDFFGSVSRHQVVSLHGPPADLGILAGYLHYNRHKGNAGREAQAL